jgi:hypothetical protein
MIGWTRLLVLCQTYRVHQMHSAIDILPMAKARVLLRGDNWKLQLEKHPIGLIGYFSMRAVLRSVLIRLA